MVRHIKYFKWRLRNECIDIINTHCELILNFVGGLYV